MVKVTFKVQATLFVSSTPDYKYWLKYRINNNAQNFQSFSYYTRLLFVWNS